MKRNVKEGGRLTPVSPKVVAWSRLLLPPAKKATECRFYILNNSKRR